MTQQPQGVQQGSQSQLVQLSSREGSAVPNSLFAELAQVLSPPATGEPYKHNLETTVNLFKVTTLLLVRLGATLFAMVVWLWGLGFQLGHYFRKWIEDTNPSTDEIVCKVLWAVTRPFVGLHRWATAFLGWEDPLRELKQDPSLELPAGEAKPSNAVVSINVPARNS